MSITLPDELNKLLSAAGIAFIRIAPRKSYWELVYKAPFNIPVKPWKVESYSERPERFTVRHVFHDAPVSKMLLQFAQDIGEYIEALQRVKEMIIELAVKNVRDDDQELEKTR